MGHGLRRAHLNCRITLVALIAGLSAPAAKAEADEALPTSPPGDVAGDAMLGGETNIREAAECPALFGEPVHREVNAAFRKAALFSLERLERTTEMVHGMPSWRDPVVRSFPGLKLLRTDLTSTPIVAHVALDETWQERCTAGVYRVRVDDSFGAEASVLGVLPGGLLLGLGEELVWLSSSDGLRRFPTFRMIWRSGFSVAANVSAPAGKSSGTPAAGAKKAKANRPSKLDSPRKAAGKRSLSRVTTRNK